jgi:TrmH family RNA methyltransferase
MLQIVRESLMKTQQIESRDNPRVKFTKRVRDGRVKDRILVEGIRLSEEALDSGVTVELCITRSGFGRNARERSILRRVFGANVPAIELSEAIFSDLADTSTPQGVILICVRPLTGLDDFGKRSESHGRSPGPFVALLQVNNPSNVGAVIRVAEAAGVKGIIVSQGSTDPFSPRSLRASMGSAFRLPMWTGAAEREIVVRARSEGRIISGAAAHGERLYTEIDWRKPRLLMFGSEAHGLSDEMMENLDETITIPMAAPVESLNLAVSAAIMLFEARRQVSAGNR